MNSYNLSGSRFNIDTSEVSSVREMIFNRAREKSSSLAAEQDENLTASVKNDVMDSAHASISDRVPKLFGNLTQNVKPAEMVEIPESEILTEVPQLKHNVQTVSDKKYTDSMRDETMIAAQRQYRRRDSLSETLKFLNTQAAIQMVSKTHSKIV